ncbi:hypothetical protein C8Q72DRAFT_797945 [Fomitopsis betulina]|nr:hypothetical protein C8Q72DRAFT_797945 [Fomitopsis betulina]
MSRATSPMHTDDNADPKRRAPPTSGAVVGAGLYMTARLPPQQAVPVTMNITTSDSAPAGGPLAASMAPAMQYQFGIVSGVEALFPSRTVRWIIREPMVPMVHHTPGSCATMTTSQQLEAAAPSLRRAEAPPTSQSASRPAAMEAPLKKIPNIMTDWDDYDSTDDLPNSDEERKKIQKQKDWVFRTGCGMRPSEDADHGATPQPSAVVEPATPEGWPEGVHPPTSTASSCAGRWADFVPRLVAQADSIMHTAYAGDRTAEERVRDLIWQLQEYTALRAVDGIARLLELWRNPAKRPALPSIQPPGVQNLNYSDDDEELHHLWRAVEASREEHRGGGVIGQSTAQADGRHAQWIGWHVAKTVHHLSLEGHASSPSHEEGEMPLAFGGRTGNGTPLSIRWEADHPWIADVSALCIMRHLAPTGDHHQWDIMTGQLFSIEGFYGNIVHTGRYPVGDGRADVSYPWPSANVTIFEVAR